jgi:hypothetical protein
VKKTIPVLKLDTQLESNLHRLLNDLSAKGLATISGSGADLKICKDIKGCD